MPLYLASDFAPNGVAGYWWDSPADVVEVEDALALDLLRIQGNGFHEEEPTAATAAALAPVEPPDMNGSYLPANVQKTDVTGSVALNREGVVQTGAEGPKLAEAIEVATKTAPAAKKAPTKKASTTKKAAPVKET